MLAGSIGSLLAIAGQSPLLQAVAIIIGTFILEDAATVAATMQVEQGTISMPVALLALCAGIVLGDLGLYGLGRLASMAPWIERQLPPTRQETIQAWLSGRLFKVVLISRFLPGLRLPTYTTCGFVRTNFKAFALAAVFATCCWTSLLFATSLRVGQFLMDHLGAWRWAGAAGFIAFIFLAARAAASAVEARR
jgi:membrane protein DedA with SNARE-associated domain